MDEFIQGGVNMMQVIVLSVDWFWLGQGKGRHCNKSDLPEESVVGISLILGAAEAEIVPECSEVQKAALQVLCYLLCGTLARSLPGPPASMSVTPSKRSSRTSRTNDVVCKV